MSTSSSNVRITCDRPNDVIDRWISTRGAPVSARSSGIVTRFSTSSAAWPGKRVITITCTFVTSGNASIFRWRNVTTPKIANASAQIRVAARRRTAKSISRSSMRPVDEAGGCLSCGRSSQGARQAAGRIQAFAGGLGGGEMPLGAYCPVNSPREGSVVLADAVTFELSVQRLAIEAEHLGGAGAVAVDRLQHAQD